jgi:hypothetical protein
MPSKSTCRDNHATFAVSSGDHVARRFWKVKGGAQGRRGWVLYGCPSMLEAQSWHRGRTWDGNPDFR